MVNGGFPICRRGAKRDVSGFSADWLSLREPFDESARSAELTEALAHLRFRDGALRVVDLATGTGANFRYLSPRLAGRQEWLLIDHDAKLLAALPERLARWSNASGYALAESEGTLIVRGGGFEARAERIIADLSAGVHAQWLAGTQIVSASALLDLVAEDWLALLVSSCRAAGAAVLFALNYDGRIEWQPRDAEDTTVHALLNRHQRDDKGFGWALGPTAAPRARTLLEKHGYRVQQRMSDWRAGPNDNVLQTRLADDLARVAIDVAPALAPAVEAWRRRRLAHINEQASTLSVGHIDLLGLL